MSQEIVLITGTSSGLGMCAAVMLAKYSSKKFKVYAGMRNTAKKDALMKKAEGCPPENLVVIQLDVCSDESVNAAVKQIMDKEGRIDHLVNNAGIGLIGVLEELSWDDMMKTYDTNVFGVFRMIRAIVPSMKKNRKGRIINVSSMGGLLPIPFNTVYGSTKYALEGMTECLAPQLAHFNIHVSAVEPGAIATDFLKTATSNPEHKPKDPASRALFDKFFENASKLWLVEGVTQTGDECAEYIVKAIIDEDPHVHYITNRHWDGPIETKFRDVTGKESFEEAKKLLQ